MSEALSCFVFGYRAPGVAIGYQEPAFAVRALRLGESLDRRRNGSRRRRMQEEPLHKMNTELLHRLILFRTLDSLRDDLRVLIIRKPHHRLDEILLDEVRVDAVDQRNVELDEIRLEVRNRAEPG